MLISAGKAVPTPPSHPMFGGIPGSMDFRPPFASIPPTHPLSMGQPPQVPPMPQLPTPRPPMLPVPPMPPVMPVRPQPPADPRPPVASVVASTASEAPRLPTSMPLISTPPPVSTAPSQIVSSAAATSSPTPAPAPTAGQDSSKPTTEAQVQQLLQLLVGTWLSSKISPHVLLSFFSLLSCLTCVSSYYFYGLITQLDASSTADSRSTGC
jgi:hypothetical protein